MQIFENIIDNFSNPALQTTTILVVIAFTLFLSLLEFLVYRLVSSREFYNRAFNICIAVIPLFISTIILSLQSNIVITLGTIGALAILRFRTAVKNPVDMLYLLWSVHIGITCGCQLYELSIITFIVVTIVLVCFEYVKVGKTFYVLIFHWEDNDEEKVLNVLKDSKLSYRIKSRNYTRSGIDYVVELRSKDNTGLANALRSAGVSKLSVLEYDNDDIV